MFDSHPSDRDRETAIEESGLEGGFRLDGEPADYPATVLFQDFERISRLASAEYYRAVLGREFQKNKLQSSRGLIESREQEIAAYETLDRYFQIRLPVLHPIPLDNDALTRPSRPNDTVKQLKEARQRMLELLPKYKLLLQRLDRVENTLFDTAVAMTLSECQLAFDSQKLGLRSGSKKVIREKHDRARHAESHLATKLIEFESEAGTRLSAALQLAPLDAVVKRIPDGDKFRLELKPLLPDALFVTRLMANLLPMRILFHRLLVLGSEIRENESREDLITKILGSMKELEQRLQDLHQRLERRGYPLDHADATMTLERFIIPSVPHPHDLGGLIHVTDNACNRLMTLQVRRFAKLAVIAEKVESALGLPKLPQPKFEESKSDKS